MAFKGTRLDELTYREKGKMEKRRRDFFLEFSQVVSCFQTLAQRFSEMPLPDVIFGHVEGMLLNIYNAQANTQLKE